MVLEITKHRRGSCGTGDLRKKPAGFRQKTCSQPRHTTLRISETARRELFLTKCNRARRIWMSVSETEGRRLATCSRGVSLH